MLSRKAIQLATLSFLFVGFIFTSSSALAYWQDVTVTRDVELVTIGEPIEIVVDDISADVGQLNLVPQGYVFAVNDVEEVTLEYEVSVSRELLNSVDLYITINDILINEQDTYSHLVDISILGNGGQAVLDLYNDTITITVTVRLIEPIDADEALERNIESERVNVEDSVLAYETIKGQTISFVMEFELQAKADATETQQQ